MPAVVRAMVEGDLDRVMAIAASLETAPHWPRAVYAGAISLDAIPRRVALVAEAEGLVVGFVVASLVADSAELESIAVASEAQRRGVGAALARALMERVRLAGATEIVLELRASNRAAGSLYGRLGFGEVGRRRGYYANPEEDAVLLRLGLKD